MTLGAENRNKAILVGALIAVVLVIVVWELWPASPTSAASVTPATRPAAAGSGKKGTPTTLDPSLQTDLLHESEGTKYEGNGKNIFVAQIEMPTPVNPGVTDRHPQPPSPPQQQLPPPPPPINLKFTGFSTQHGGAKQVFLTDGDDIFIAKEGDIVNRRYKVLHIYPMAVEIQDVLNNNVQQIPLTQS